MGKGPVVAIFGYRDEHPLADGVEGGQAGVIHHDGGIGSVKVQLRDGYREVYIPGTDLAHFAWMYAVIGSECLATLTEKGITQEDFKRMEHERRQRR